MDSFDWTSTETEQIDVKQKDTQTITRESTPVPASAPEVKPQPQETLVPQQAPDQPIGLAPFSQASTELAYSCLLIPRFSDHYLAGDICDDLLKWMKELCISYGWRLEAITIRPGYLHWVVSVPLTVNPAQLMRLTRQQTSQRIFEDYPRFRRKNVSPDFWAPGFSVMPGNRAQSLEAINNFIVEVRKQQGIF